MADRLDEIIDTINDHKAELLALQSLTVALLRALPLDLQSRAFAEWDTETEFARTMLLSSKAPDDLAAAFEKYVAALNALRIRPPAT